MKEKAFSISDLDSPDLSKFVMDMFHRTVMHYALWFKEVEHQLGSEKAMEIMEEVSDKSIGIQLNRLAAFFGFSMTDGVPDRLAGMKADELVKLTSEAGKNWLANDGIWFQAVEKRYGMNDAKRCNDTCWTKFSPFEAWSIARFLELGENPGLEGLKRALQFRMYAGINVQSITDEEEKSFVFRMNDCRVQSARKRKGLADYPCKSAGLVEYGTFASSIDKRIKTECIGCPPDDHPDEWFCAWKFYID